MKSYTMWPLRLVSFSEANDFRVHSFLWLNNIPVYGDA